MSPAVLLHSSLDLFYPPKAGISKLSGPYHCTAIIVALFVKVKFNSTTEILTNEGVSQDNGLCVGVVMPGCCQRPLGVVVRVAGLLASHDDVVPNVAGSEQVD